MDVAVGSLQSGVGLTLATLVVCLLLSKFPKISPLKTPNVLRLSYVLTLWLALAVVGILMVEPNLLTRYAPNWKSSAGWALLGGSLLCVSRAFGRVLKASTMLVVWSGVSIVLASQIFLNKMPHMIDQKDLTRLNAVVSAETTESVLYGLRRILRIGQGAMISAGFLDEPSIESVTKQAASFVRSSRYQGDLEATLSQSRDS